MKLPSIHFLLENAKRSFLRFPLTLISAGIAVVVAVYLTECHDEHSNIFPILNIMLCSLLGIPLYFCVVVFSEKMGFNKTIRWLLALLGTVVLFVIFLTLPGTESTHNITMPYVKYAIYAITVHLLVSFLPFINSAGLNGYWQYNKLLFIRVWASVLYSGFLYVGLALALGSMKLLFDIHIHDELFFDIFLIVVGIFNTWFFISGIPSDLDKLNKVTEYPKGLKVFSQYVLLPLLGLFLIILYLYGGKILILWQWPKGIVSNLIVGISVLGILTFLLLHPYGSIAGNQWIKLTSRGYYFALAPLLIILFIAIGMRTNEYGITISRYVIILLGVWLSVLCIYTIIGKTNIKFIPASLAIMLMLMSFGPWGMFTASERSQVNRLKKIMEFSGILKNGKINNETLWLNDSLPELASPGKYKNEGILNDSLHNEVYSILQYLDDHHGFCSIRQWYKQNIDSTLTAINLKKNRYSQQDEADFYMLSMGLKAQTIYKNHQNDFYNFQTETQPVLNISGFDYMIRFDHDTFNNDSLISSFMLDSITCSLYSPGKDKPLFFIKYGDQKFHFNLDSLIIDLWTGFREKNETNVPSSRMRLSGSTGHFHFRTDFDHINIQGVPDSLRVSFLSGTLFIRRK